MVKIVRYFNRLFHQLGQRAMTLEGKLSSTRSSGAIIKSYFTRPYLPVFLTFIFGLGLSLAGYIIAYRWERAQARVILDEKGDNLAIALQNKIDNYIQVTEALAAFYNASDEVTRQDFTKFSQHLFENYPGITGLAWAQLVLNSERNAYEEMLKNEGFPNYRLYDIDENQQYFVVSTRNEYIPVTYGFPTEIYKEIIGYDLFFNDYKELLEKAKKTGEMVASEQMSLITNGRKAFILFQPIYSNNLSKKLLPEQQNKSFLGTIYTIYTISEIVRASLEAIDFKNIDFYLLDESATSENSFLAYYDSSRGKIRENLPDKKMLFNQDEWGFCQAANTCKRLVKVADRQWSILLSPTGEFEDKTFYLETFIIVEFLLTLFLTIYLAMSIKYTLELEAAMKKLQSTQAQLIQAEKMSSLGQLVAGVAHEINNPVNFIYGNLNPAMEYGESLLKLLELYEEESQITSEKIQEFVTEIDLDFIKCDFPKSIESMKIGAERIQKILLSLRNFSRLDEGVMKLINIHEGLDSSLTILQSRLRANVDKSEINLIKKYDDLPRVECYAAQLNQVFMNLIANAIDALEELRDKKDFTPRIKITTEAIASSQIIIKIEDNGPGIPEEIREDIFNPFFTTKPPGKGTGLGLSIAYSIIVEKHRGELKFSSEKGKGTEFVITIPSSPL